MANTTTIVPEAQPEQPTATRVQKRFPARHHLALAGIMLISVFMNFCMRFWIFANGPGKQPRQH